MADTLYQQLRAQLAYLRPPAIGEHLAPALEAAERDKPGYTEFLHQLVAAEVDAVEQRRLQGRLRFAKLPARKTLEQFDFTAQPSLDRRLVDDLAALRFIDERANLLLIGPPGVGKTMLATILGHQAVETGYRVYYTTAADLVARTARAALEGRWATTMRFWNGPQLLILDELGYLPRQARPAVTSSKSSAAATSTARSSSPPTGRSPTGAPSSTTAPSPSPSSTASCTTPPSSRSPATATACAATATPSKRCGPPSPAEPRLGNPRRHTQAIRVILDGSKVTSLEQTRRDHVGSVRTRVRTAELSWPDGCPPSDLELHERLDSEWRS